MSEIVTFVRKQFVLCMAPDVRGGVEIGKMMDFFVVKIAVVELKLHG